MKFISITLFLLLASSAVSQSKMRTIKNKIKEKVQVYDEVRERQREEIKKQTKKQQGERADYSEEQFLRDYKYDDDDEIPWNAIIQVFDGRVLDEIPAYNIVEEKPEDEQPRQLYQAYPLKNDFFIDPYIGSPVFAFARGSFGYDATDSVALYDWEFTAAYEMFSLNIKHQMLRFSTDIEHINFDFTSISPGLIFAMPDKQSYVQLFAGIGFFNIDTDNYTLGGDKFDRTFSGVNLGGSLTAFLGYNFSFHAKLDFMAVEYDDLSDYFMNFLLTEYSLGYVYERFGIQLGLKYQEFRDIDIEDPENTFELSQPFFAIYSYF